MNGRALLAVIRSLFPLDGIQSEEVFDRLNGILKILYHGQELAQLLTVGSFLSQKMAILEPLLPEDDGVSLVEKVLLKN